MRRLRWGPFLTPRSRPAEWLFRCVGFESAYAAATSAIDELSGASATTSSSSDGEDDGGGDDGDGSSSAKSAKSSKKQKKTKKKAKRSDEEEEEEEEEEGGGSGGKGLVALAGVASFDDDDDPTRWRWPKLARADATKAGKPLVAELELTSLPALVAYRKGAAPHVFEGAHSAAAIVACVVVVRAPRRACVASLLPSRPLGARTRTVAARARVASLLPSRQLGARTRTVACCGQAVMRTNANNARLAPGTRASSPRRRCGGCATQTRCARSSRRAACA